MRGGALPHAQVLLLAILYGVGAHGIMTLNDFKAIKGDRGNGDQLAARSAWPESRRAGLLRLMAAPQFIVIALLMSWGRFVEAGVVALLLIAQLLMMRRFLRAPVADALWYSGFGVPLYVFGMMASAVAVRVFAAT